MARGTVTSWPSEGTFDGQLDGFAPGSDQVTRKTTRFLSVDCHLGYVLKTEVANWGCHQSSLEPCNRETPAEAVQLAAAHVLDAENPLGLPQFPQIIVYAWGS